MKHYMMIKLAEGANATKVQEKIWKACQKQDDALDWMTHPVIYPCSSEARSDFDLMVQVSLDGEEQLADFEAQPQYVKLMEDLGDKVARVCVFNHY